MHGYQVFYFHLKHPFFELDVSHDSDVFINDGKLATQFNATSMFKSVRHLRLDESQLQCDDCFVTVQVNAYSVNSAQAASVTVTMNDETSRWVAEQMHRNAGAFMLILCPLITIAALLAARHYRQKRLEQSTNKVVRVGDEVPE